MEFFPRTVEFDLISAAITVLLIALTTLSVTITFLVRRKLQTWKHIEEALRTRTRELEAAHGRAERELKQLSAILSSMSEGLIVVEKNMHVTLMNQAAAILLRVAPADAVGRTIHEVFTVFRGKKGSPKEESALLAKVIEHTNIVKIKMTDDYYTQNREGGVFPISGVFASLLADGEAVGAIILFRNVDEEKEIDRAKSEFVSLASHQLRTPLSSINWYTEMLQAQDVGKVNKKQVDYLNEIYQASRRMGDLVKNLLNVSRLELGTFIIQPEALDAKALIQSVLSELKPQIIPKKLIVKEEYGMDLPMLNADPKLMRMIIQNLLSNAVKYTPDGGTVGVALHIIPTGAPLFAVGKQGNAPKDTGPSKGRSTDFLLRVWDTGFGIPKTQQGDIFTKLFRADNIKVMDVEGTGLGLYIVKQILDAAGGQISFESEENKGTTFYITLPSTGMAQKVGTKNLG